MTTRIQTTPWFGRTTLAAAALVLAVLGAMLAVADRPESVFEIWPPILIASWAPPALAVSLHVRRAQRWICIAAAVVTGLVALPLALYGYGLTQFPTVVLLVLAGQRDR